MTSHLVIYDTQLKPTTDSTFCKWFGQFMMDRRPDKVIVMGDWWDMKSLSKYDKGLQAVGRSYYDDIQAGIKGMELMMEPYFKYVKNRKSNKKGYWKPELHFLMGNHEERVLKFVNDNPVLEGTVGYKDFQLERFGFKCYDFLEPVKLNGVLYSHYIKNKNSAYPKASAKATIEQTFMSTVQGHKPGLDVHTVWSDRTGRSAWSIINGSSYLEPEGYRKGGGNDHWRGITLFNNVIDGDFDPEFISMECLQDAYRQ